MHVQMMVGRGPVDHSVSYQPEGSTYDYVVHARERGVVRMQSGAGGVILLLLYTVVATTTVGTADRINSARMSNLKKKERNINKIKIGLLPLEQFQ